MIKDFLIANVWNIFLIVGFWLALGAAFFPWEDLPISPDGALTDAWHRRRAFSDPWPSYRAASTHPRTRACGGPRLRRSPFGVRPVGGSGFFEPQTGVRLIGRSGIPHKSAPLKRRVSVLMKAVSPN